MDIKTYKLLWIKSSMTCDSFYFLCDSMEQLNKVKTRFFELLYQDNSEEILKFIESDDFIYFDDCNVTCDFCKIESKEHNCLINGQDGNGYIFDKLVKVIERF